MRSQTANRNLSSRPWPGLRLHRQRISASSPSSGSPPIAQVEEDFTSLASRHGCSLNCRLGVGSRGRGLFSNSDIKLNDVILKAPLSIALVEPSVSDGSKLSRNVRLALSLLSASHASGSENQGVSLWPQYKQDYIPPPLDHPPLLLASDEELNFLQDEELAQALSGARRTLDKAKDELKSLSGTITISHVENMADFEWAYALTQSRAHSFSTSAGIPHALFMPFADMANHSVYPSAVFEVTPDDKFYQLRASRPIPAGEEVTISYGSHLPNSILSLNFGFIQPGNPNDSLSFDLLSPFYGKYAVQPLTEAFERDRQKMEEGDELRRLNVVHRSLVAFGRRGEPQSGETDKESLTDLMGALSSKLDSYPTTIDEDRALLQSRSPISLRLMTCIAFRLENKLVLQAAIELVGKALLNL